MKIRSITLGMSLEGSLPAKLERAGQVVRSLQDRFQGAGFEVQTTRLCLPRLNEQSTQSDAIEQLAARIEGAALAAGFEYVALGPLQSADRDQAERLARALVRHERLFGTVETATEHRVDARAAEAAALAMRVLADETDAGFGNLRFAAIARCQPGIPFFPAAYHDGGTLAFSLALQGADLAVAAFETVRGLAEAEGRLREAVESALRPLETIAVAAEAELQVRFLGLDPTLAPFPSDDESIGAALERLGLGRFGAAGTVTAAALVTRALKSVSVRRSGFAGLMLPVLEDSVLARRAGEGAYSWPELLLYSAVCGTGLDTVPLPGDTSVETLAAIILDLSTLAVALDKPLTCRLLAVPGKQAGEMTDFDFPFFANARILDPGVASPLLVQRADSGAAS
jgi:uncharacterized protein (UPF0210 family)